MGIFSYFLNRSLYDASRSVVRSASRSGWPAPRIPSNGGQTRDSNGRARQEFAHLLEINFDYIVKHKHDLSMVSATGFVDDTAWIEWWRQFGRKNIVPIANRYDQIIAESAFRAVSLPFLEKVGAAVDRKRHASTKQGANTVGSETTDRIGNQGNTNRTGLETVTLCPECGNWGVKRVCGCGCEKPDDAIRRSL